jgi:hypothetical protein
MAQIILTNHVKKRALERGVSLQDLDKVVRFPDSVTQSKNNSSKKHTKNFGSYQIVVPIKRQGNNWVTVSAWKKPVYSSNRYKDKKLPKQLFLERIINNGLLKLEKVFSRRSNR